jgi:hypothetical protein
MAHPSQFSVAGATKERSAIMVHRFLILMLAALTLALFAGQPVLADDKVHDGKVVKAGDGKLTMTSKDDPKKQHTHDVAKDAMITLDGKETKLKDLKEGHHVKVTMDDKHKVTKIDAHSHGHDK